MIFFGASSIILSMISAILKGLPTKPSIPAGKKNTSETLARQERAIDRDVATAYPPSSGDSTGTSARASGYVHVVRDLLTLATCPERTFADTPMIGAQPDDRISRG